MRKSSKRELSKKEFSKIVGITYTIFKTQMNKNYLGRKGHSAPRVNSRRSFSFVGAPAVFPPDITSLETAIQSKTSTTPGRPSTSKRALNLHVILVSGYLVLTAVN